MKYGKSAVITVITVCLIASVSFASGASVKGKSFKSPADDMKKLIAVIKSLIKKK